ncbi:hypothetical protein DO62_6179 [Burkholderia pseudomallei]|nr:hypothetical protein DO62_6179 [Burkholderia pseudomallei]KGX48309.1 putative type III secretion domain protein [Burkholderia pseudomallei MSHR3709]
MRARHHSAPPAAASAPPTASAISTPTSVAPREFCAAGCAADTRSTGSAATEVTLTSSYVSPSTL